MLMLSGSEARIRCGFFAAMAAQWAPVATELGASAWTKAWRPCATEGFGRPGCRTYGAGWGQ